MSRKMSSLQTTPAGKRGMASAGLVSDSRPKRKQSRMMSEPYAVETTQIEQVYCENQMPRMASSALDETESRPLPLLPEGTPPPTPDAPVASKLVNSQPSGEGRAGALRPPGELENSLGWTGSPSVSPHDGSNDDSGVSASAGGSNQNSEITGSCERSNSLTNWARVPTFWGSEQIQQEAHTLAFMAASAPISVNLPKRCSFWSRPWLKWLYRTAIGIVIIMVIVATGPALSLNGSTRRIHKGYGSPEAAYTALRRATGNVWNYVNPANAANLSSWLTSLAWARECNYYWNSWMLILASCLFGMIGLFGVVAWHRQQRNDGNNLVTAIRGFSLFGTLRSQAQRLGRGLEFVYLHYMYRPLLFAPRVAEIHEYVDAHHANAISVANQGVLLPKANTSANNSCAAELRLNDNTAASSGRNASDNGAVNADSAQSSGFMSRCWSSVSFTASFEATTLHTQVNEVLATPFHPVVDDTRFFDANAAASSSNASSSSSTSLSAEGPPTMFRSISNKVTTAFSSISNSSYVNQSSPPLPLPPPGLERAVSSARTVALDEKRRRLLASLEDYHGLDLLTSSTNGRKRARSRVAQKSSSSLWSAAGAHLEAGIDAVAALHKLPLKLERGATFDSAAEQVLAASHSSVFRGLHIVYTNQSGGAWEEGIDCGGLTKEFFSEILQEVTEWDSADHPSTSSGSSSRALMQRQITVRGRTQPLFRSLPDKSLMLRSSERPPMYYMALGKIFAMALLYGLPENEDDQSGGSSNSSNSAVTLGASLSTALLKFMTRQPISASDVRALDPAFFKHRMEAMLHPGGVEYMQAVLGEDKLFFTSEPGDGVGADDCTSDFACSISSKNSNNQSNESQRLPDGMVELMPGGANVEVNEDNKLEYLVRLSEHYLCGGVRRPLSAFLRGFHELVPSHLLLSCGIDDKDLGLLLTGLPELNLHEWRANCDLAPCASIEAAAVVGHFFAALADFAPHDQAKVLQFGTGLSHLPVGGFARLRPRFKIVVKLHASPIELPTAHTCFNTLELPPYASQDVLAEKLLLAATEGAGAFALA